MRLATRRTLFTLLAIAGLAVWVLIEAREENDFDIFLQAAHDLTKGENIHARLYHRWYHYNYSAFFALLLRPFTALSPYAAKLIWLSINLVLAYRTWRICLSFLPLSKLSKRALMVLTVLSALFVLRFMRDNIHLGQMTIVMLYLSLEGISLITKERKTAGAALIALAINIKLLPLVLLPWLFYRREVLAGTLVVVFYAALMLLPSLFIGHQYNLFLIREWAVLVNPVKPQHLIDVSEKSLHGLSTVLPTLLMEVVRENEQLPIRRNIANLTSSEVATLLMVARLVLMTITLYFLRTRPFRKAPSPLHLFWEVSYILLLIPLIFPRQQSYSFLMMAPALVYLCYFFFMTRQYGYAYFSRSRFKLVVAVMSLVFLVCNATIILGHCREYYEHFKILTYAALITIIPLALCRPAYLERKLSLHQQPDGLNRSH